MLNVFLEPYVKRTETEQPEKDDEDLPSDLTEEMIMSRVKHAAGTEVTTFKPITGSPQSFEEMLKQMIDTEVNFSFAVCICLCKILQL